MAKRSFYVGQPTTAAGAAYSAASTQNATIFSFTVTNTTATAVTLSAWVGASAVDATKVLESVSIPGAATFGIQEMLNVTIPKSSTLYLAASTASALTVQVSGDAVTA